MSVCPLLQETILNYSKDPTPQPNNLDHVSSLRNHAWIWIYVLVCVNTHVQAYAHVCKRSASQRRAVIAVINSVGGKKKTDQGRQCLFIRFKPRFELKLSRFCP